jgi:hypothetical protein
MSRAEERGQRKLKAAEWVEVRSKEEILRTLDSKGELDGMPFMPEMLQFCGKKFQVYRRSHKTCDTVYPVRGRRLNRAVHLETRCDGQAHGGCQAGCLIFWKEAWLKTSDRKSSRSQPVRAEPAPAHGISASADETTESVVWTNVQRPVPPGAPPVYVCQATRLPYATAELAWWDVRQYIEDYTSGNVGFGRILGGFIYSIYYNLSQAGIGLGRPMRWLYDKCYGLWRGAPFPRKCGTIPTGQPTPLASLNLQPGELVRVKSYQEILRTLTTDNRNRGLLFDAEMVPYCGGTYRVLKRVSRIINERTGEMQEMKNACLILDSVICQSRYSGHRMFCPRSIYSYWREIWLERVESNASGVARHSASVR